MLFTQTETLFALVNGRWSAWLSWGACSRTCGGGAQRRSRTCTNPPPRNGGAACSGGRFQTRQCNSIGCPGTFLIVNTVQESIMLHTNLSRKRLSSQFIKHFCSLREESTFPDAITGFPATWRPTNGRSNSIRITRHYPDLGSGSVWLKQISHADRPIRSTTQIWVVNRHQWGISSLSLSWTTSPRKSSRSGSGNVGCFLALTLSCLNWFW